jgi:DNA helicase-2/ATP-dependent DNA helicase PcrA
LSKSQAVFCDKIKKMLNNQQKQAVEYHQGPLLIIAGAGTGKTTVIINKIEDIIKNNLAKPEEILALTFTEKAAYEMEERLDKKLPYGYFQMTIDTFHGFADQILKQEIINIGLSNNYKLLTETEAIIFFKKNLFQFDLNFYQPVSNPEKFIENLINHFSRLKDENISPNEYLDWVKNNKELTPEEKEKYLELAFAYEKYQKLKIKNELFDFSDLIFYLIQLLKNRPIILKEYQKRFKFILVDEFQDTNIAQYELIKLLAPPKINPKLTVVGDDSQAIYKFRGASVSNILTFMKDYPQAKQITLLKNYRSNQEILDKSYQLIKANDPDTLEAKLGISKKLIAVEKSIPDQPIDFYLGETIEDEADFVVKKILELKEKYHYQYSDFAILCRANNHADPFIQTLNYKGIPYQFLGPNMLFKQPEIKDLIAYLKIINDLSDNVSFYRVLSMNIFEIDSVDLSLFVNFSNKTNLSFFESLEIYLSFYYPEYLKEEFKSYHQLIPLLKKETKEKFRKIFELIKKHLSFIRKNTPGEILYDFLEKTGYLKKLINYKTDKEEKIALNITKFLQRLKIFENENKENTIADVVDYLDLSLEMGESPIAGITDISTYNAVNILTVHSAKGLEFPVVFLVNLTQNRFPTRNRKETIPIPDQLIKEILPENDPHIEEERRLFYVGMTRAKDHLYLTASKFYHQNKRQQKISKFVLETFGEDYINKKISFKEEEKKQLTFFYYQKIENEEKNPSQIKNYFSYTQLESYKRCPLQYKYYYVLNLPTPPNAPSVFGETIHKTLNNFYQIYKKNKDAGEKEILEIYFKNWKPIGFLSKQHENKYKKTGEKILLEYLKKFHNKNLDILFLEIPFKIKIKEDIFLTGKIDRIDKINENKVEIIDYKTGKKPEEKEIKKDPQLSIYALAVNKLYKKKPEDIILTYYYLEKQEKISFQKNQDDIEKITKEILQTVEEIKSNDYYPQPGKYCDFCPFRIICEAWR